ncbi:serine hydrolase [Companilactobacillus keshanensis]|uniref:Serine hydrolase n=1 Tax=Companilactobacillus keshanensis TaxID=2486003 RepID=A0ABW4BRS8_9LACO|nr:serine hydrolase [Companilactobacillus keshanensis]
MIKCQKCGHLNAADSKFCENCGAPFENRQPQQSVKPIQQQSQSTPPHKPKKSNKSMIIWLIIIILLVAAGGYDYMTHHRNENSQTEQTKSISDSNDKQSDDDSSQKHSSETNSDVKSLLSNNLGGIKGDTSAFYYDLNNNDSASYGDDEDPQRAASDIKVYIMAAAYQKIDDGDMSLDGRYELTSEDKVGGTGVVQNMQVGDSLTYRDLIDYMITKSDNTAANIITKEIGGLDAVNDEIDELDLSRNTKMERMLMDQDALSEGKDNMTTAHDLAMFMRKLYHHDVVSDKYDKQMLSILSNTSNHSKLPANINTNVVDVYNKTGEYAQYGVENDAAIFKRGNKAFVLVVMSQNGDSDEQKSAMGSLGKQVTQEVLDK